MIESTAKSARAVMFEVQNKGAISLAQIDVVEMPQLHVEYDNYHISVDIELKGGRVVSATFGANDSQTRAREVAQEFRKSLLDALTEFYQP